MNFVLSSVHIHVWVDRMVCTFIETAGVPCWYSALSKIVFKHIVICRYSMNRTQLSSTKCLKKSHLFWYTRIKGRENLQYCSVDYGLIKIGTLLVLIVGGGGGGGGISKRVYFYLVTF